MRRQWKSGYKMIGILLATAALGMAQTSGSVYGGGGMPPAAGTNIPGQPSTMPRPGTVNYLEGQVSINGTNLQPSASGATVLQPNEVISTRQGYAEVLLTPGAFLRIGNNSEARMISAGLADMRLELVHGSAMVEVAQLIKGTNMAVTMNGMVTQIADKGLYDFDTNQQFARVLDGKAKIAQTTLKKGDEVVFSGTAPLKKRDFDSKAAKADPLYVWSKVRSENESAANVDAANRVAVYGGWYGPGWYWDPFWSSYAFVPGWGILGSPFGWGFYSPGFVYAAPYGGRGYYGRGFRGGMNGVHAAGGMHSGMGGFHGGGGHSGGGGHGR
jgi:uncharacterized membrane protein YgcG